MIPNTIDDILYELILEPPSTLPTGCWIWPNGVFTRGYGKAVYRKKTRKVHRIIYEHFRGHLPVYTGDGLELDHLCRNRRCCNPDHLDLVPHRENVLRGEGVAAINARKTHCKHGHPFSEENTYVVLHRRGRMCKECGRIRDKARKAKLREARKLMTQLRMDYGQKT